MSTEQKCFDSKAVVINRANKSNRCSWKRKPIKSWMHGWPSQCVMLLRLSCARAHRRSSSCRLGGARKRSAARARGHSTWELRLRLRPSRERQVGCERRPGAACGLDSCVSPPLPRGPPHRSPLGHIIYDSIWARSKLAILYKLMITRFSSHAMWLFHFFGVCSLKWYQTWY